MTERSVVNSPFERSVRGAAYIYTNKPSSQPNGTSRQAVQSAVPTTANEAIKLALKKLAERSEKHDDTQRVSNLAQQLAKVSCFYITQFKQLNLISFTKVLSSTKKLKISLVQVFLVNLIKKHVNVH